MAGKQFWLGPARSGVRVTSWAGCDVIHLLIAGGRVKTLRSHLSVNDLAALANGWSSGRTTAAAAAIEVDQQLVARPKRRRRCLTRADKTARRTPDLVGRDFSAAEPNLKWCGDLTEIPTTEGKLYLAAVEYLVSRRLLGFAMSDRQDASWLWPRCGWPPPSAAAASPG